MKFQIINPAEELQHLISSCWHLQDENKSAPNQTFHTLADGRPGLIFHRNPQSGPLQQFDKKLPTVFLYGQGTAYSEIISEGGLDLMGFYFQPYALRAIFGIDSDEITDSCIDLDDLSRKQGYSLSERLLYAKSPEQQARIISDFLFPLLKKNGAKMDLLTQHVVSSIAEKQGRVALPELRQRFKISERSLERKFLQQIGISPKMYLRVHRFQNALTQIRLKGFEKLTDVAYDNEYADQSHFLRDFKAFSGFSPAQYLKRTQELVANFSEVAV